VPSFSCNVLQRRQRQGATGQHYVCVGPPTHRLIAGLHEQSACHFVCNSATIHSRACHMCTVVVLSGGCQELIGLHCCANQCVSTALRVLTSAYAAALRVNDDTLWATCRNSTDQLGRRWMHNQVSSCGVISPYTSTTECTAFSAPLWTQVKSCKHLKRMSQHSPGSGLGRTCGVLQVSTGLGSGYTTCHDNNSRYKI
jgi:hypothetical protein